MAHSTIPHIQIVRQIIDEELQERGKAHKWGVIETIKSRIHPTMLFNRICNSKKNCTTDGIKNMHRGAQAMCSDCLYRSKDRYMIDDDGWITAINKPAPARSATDLFCC